MNGIAFLRLIRRLATKRGWAMEEKPGKGSHMKVTLNGAMTIIPQHRSDLPTGTQRAILKQLGLTPDDLED